MKVTERLAAFAAEIAYRDIPPAVVHETKRLILDSVGCVLGGIRTRKGELALRLARSLGGPCEASLPGAGEKVSAASSAFATGELMNALDYEALLSPPAHATPYVLAAPLAVGEMKRASGRDLIVAAAVAHEISTRLAASLDFGCRFDVTLPERGIRMSMPTPGYGLCTFGGAAAAARLAGMDAGMIAHAMGLAGSMAPVPMVVKFATSLPASLAKYQSSGALSLQEVLSVMWADIGCTGDTEILDGDHGFWRATGCEGWAPERVTRDLGRAWHFPMRLFYKPFPCCGAMQNALAHFLDIITTHDLAPADITGVTVRLNPLAELPLWRHGRVENHVEAQFSTPFVMAALAHRLEVGPAWQRDEALRDDGIRGFMKKVEVVTDLDGEGRTRAEVEVRAGRGAAASVFSKEGWSPTLAMDDQALADKFRRNARGSLGEEGTERAISLLLGLEDCPRVDDVMACLFAGDGVAGPVGEE